MSDRVREMLEDMMDIEKAASLVKDVDNLAESLNTNAEEVCKLMKRDYQEYLDAKALLAEELELEPA